MTQDKGPTTYTEGQPTRTEAPRGPMVPPQEADGTQSPVPGAPAQPAPTTAPAKPARTRKAAQKSPKK